MLYSAIFIKVIQYSEIALCANLFHWHIVPYELSEREMTSMATNRFRLQFKFWLDMHKPDEQQLAKEIDQLKQGRAFSQVVRDGIRLIMDLWNGNLTVLLALFPWVEDAFYQRFLEQQPNPETTIQEQLQRLEQLLIEQGNTPIENIAQPGAATPGSPKAMIIPQVNNAVFEDDNQSELVVKKAKSDGKSAQNFLDSAFGLIG
ncbi:MAG: hypothetical protein CL610_16545 [Anaerolineaceae bacterium]|nr:hypothetical protein [Anaerolineaceae bacterium]